MPDHHGRHRHRRRIRPAMPMRLAKKPHLDVLFEEFPNTLIEASGEAVGLPEGQMGNSEVGHLNIGAGRIVYQDLTRINDAIEDGDVRQQPRARAGAVDRVKAAGRTLHVFGLLSDGGVHCHIEHIKALRRDRHGATASRDAYVHAFLDGRDAPPQSAAAYARRTRSAIARRSRVGARSPSVRGRYYAMDRDKRWDRVERGLRRCWSTATAPYAADAGARRSRPPTRAARTTSSCRPTAVVDATGNRSRIADGDAVVFMNFRADRARRDHPRAVPTRRSTASTAARLPRARRLRLP
ncbi:MAG: hypothetical protein MZU97_06690 [Bacillus subtilis]|nr:hypothetical protein [Bacillus subtilis]